MKKIKFIVDFGIRSKGETVEYIVDEHANTLIQKGVAVEATTESKAKKKAE
jgi:hypothetical protein